MNLNLDNLLRCLAKDNIKQWDLSLAQADFVYNNSVNQTTGKCSFKIMCGQITGLADETNKPRVSDDAISFAENLKEIKVFDKD